MTVLDVPSTDVAWLLEIFTGERSMSGKDMILLLTSMILLLTSNYVLSLLRIWRDQLSSNEALRQKADYLLDAKGTAQFGNEARKRVERAMEYERLPPNSTKRSLPHKFCLRNTWCVSSGEIALSLIHI